jgi:hypothetical protein
MLHNQSHELSRCLIFAMSSFRRILPVADLGMAFVNSTFRTFLYGATSFPTKLI